GYAMKKAQTVSRQAYMAGAKDMVDAHVDLMEEAERVLPKSELGKVAEAVAKARTPAQLRRIAMSIQILADHAKVRQAMARFKKTKLEIKKSSRLGKIRPEYQVKIDALLDSVQETTHGSKLLGRMNRLMEMLEVHEDPNIPHSVIRRAQEVLASKLRTPLGKLDADTINGITAALQRIVHLNNVKQRMLFGRKARSKAQALAESVAEVEKSNPKIKVQEGDTAQQEAHMNAVHWAMTTGQLSAETKAIVLVGDNGTGYEILYANPQEGARTTQEIQNGASDVLRKVLEETGVAKEFTKWCDPASRPGWLRRAGRWILGKNKSLADIVATPMPKATRGGARLAELRLTHGQRIDLINHLLDPNTRAELLKKSAKGIRLRGIFSSPIKLYAEDIAALEKSFTAKEKQIAEAMRTYVNTVLRDKINEAWLNNEGYEIAWRKDYWPRVRDKEFNETEPDKAMLYWVQNQLDTQGIFKPRTGGSEAIFVDDGFTKFQAHVGKSAAYIGKQAAVLDALRLLNDPTFRQEVKSRLKYGAVYLRDMEKAVKEYRGLEARTNAQYDKIVGRIIRQAHVGALGANPAVALYQTVSLGTALAEMDARDILAVWNWRLPTKKGVADMLAHSPILRARYEGTAHQVLTPGFAGATVNQFATNKTPGWRNQAMRPVHAMDEMAILNIWRAALHEGQRKHGLDGEALMDWAARRAEGVVERTQPTWDPLTVSGLSIEARESTVAKLATLFSSQRAK
ncbi:MAG TPA: hypothetical protein VMY35_05495, partial [Phycisphaerae bacterium]|nr:hypothetical protein [Phycisphaerae bacterium]